MRVARAFAFIDLCGFTEFTECHGDEVAVQVLAQLRAGVREIAARRGVRVAKWLGDGAMLSSTATDSLVSMTIEIRHRLRLTIPDLAVRVGMDLGAVIMFEGDDYIGRAVNVASRICDEAAAGQILATAEVAGELPAWTTPSDRRAMVFKGFTHAIDVVSIDIAASTPATAVTDPVCGLTIAAPFAIRTAPTTPAAFCSLDCAEALGQRRPHGQPTPP